MFRQLKITCAVVMLVGIAANAEIPACQVFDLRFNAIGAAATTTIDSGYTIDDNYAYREKDIVLRGVLVGCGRGSMSANGSCQNDILYMWDETRKFAITNIETGTGWRIQGLGKNLCEHFMRLKCTYGGNKEYAFDVTLCGFGNKVHGATNTDLWCSSINGHFAGLAETPCCRRAGIRKADRIDTYRQSELLSMCECCKYESETISEPTPFSGSYSVHYNPTKSYNASTNGISPKTLGLPWYVNVLYYVEINNGE